MQSKYYLCGANKCLKIVVTNVNAPPLLGRNFLRAFGFDLIQTDQVNSIDIAASQKHSIIVDQLKSEFSDLFDGQLGKYNVCEISLPIDSDAKPIFFKPRPIPIAWKSKIEQNAS